MKKVLLSVLFLFISLFLFAYQETYRADSYEVRVFNSLKRIAGDNPAEPTYPISGTQLLNMYKNLNKDKLPAEGKALYDEITDSLKNKFFNTDYNSKSTSWDLIADLNLEGFVRSTNKKTSYDKLYNELPSIEPMVNLGAYVWLGDFVTGRFEYPFGEQFSTDYFNRHLYTTLLMKSPEEKAPYEAWVSLGTDLYNVILGRDNLSAGNGRAGNLVFSDNFMWNDFTKASVITDSVSYDLTFLTMGREKSQCLLTSNDFTSDSNFTVNHRFSASILNKANFIIYEGMIEYGSNMLQNLAILNPFMCLHNIESYPAGNNNNYFGVEASGNIFKGFEVGGQFLFDQIQYPDEVKGKEGKVPSNAFASLFNVSYSTFFKGGLLDSYFEAVYVSPVCYLKETNARGSNYQSYQTDFIFGNQLDVMDYYNYLGYPSGPDSISFALGASYMLDKLNASFDCSYTLRGDYGIYGNQVINTAWKYYNSNSPLVTTEGKANEHNIKLGFKGSYEVYEGVDLSLSVAYIKAVNLYNQKGVSLDDIQCSFGAKVKLPTLAKNIIQKF